MEPSIPSQRVVFRRLPVALAALFAAAAALFVPARALFGAEITLLDDRVWEGVIVREDKDVVVLDTAGGEIEITRTAIKAIDRSPTRRELYQIKLDAIDRNDPDQHYLLGLWCRRQNLTKEAEYHLNYAIGLDPEHEGARRALGQVKYEGKWMAEAQAKEAQGLRFYNGRWMTKEAAAQAEAEDLKNSMKAELGRQVRALAEAIANPRSDEAKRRAMRQLWTLRDPLAADAIVELLSNHSSEVREVGIQAADKLKLDGADGEILRCALYDEDASVRAGARKSLASRWKPGMLPETLRALKDTDSPMAPFAAALVLGVTRDPVSVDSLIEALYVTYAVKRGEEGSPKIGIGGVVTRQPGPLDNSGGVITDPVAGVVGAGPGVAWRPLDAPDDRMHEYIINYAALDTLRSMTQKDFGVNKRAWREWWDANRDDFKAWKEAK